MNLNITHSLLDEPKDINIIIIIVIIIIITHQRSATTVPTTLVLREQKRLVLRIVLHIKRFWLCMSSCRLATLLQRSDRSVPWPQIDAQLPAIGRASTASSQLRWTKLACAASLEREVHLPHQRDSVHKQW